MTHKKICPFFALASAMAYSSQEISDDPAYSIFGQASDCQQQECALWIEESPTNGSPARCSLWRGGIEGVDWGKP